MFPINGTMGPLVVPLPEGMSIADYLSLERSSIAIAISVAVAFGILIWDHLCLLLDEFELYGTMSKSVWRSPAPYAFVILRYSGILAILPVLFYTAIPNDHCQIAVTASQIGSVLVTGAAGVIFGYRVIAIWNGNSAIFGLVSVAWFMMVGCWIAVGSQYRGQSRPYLSLTSNCMIYHAKYWGPLCCASSFAFDSIILILSLVKLNANRAHHSRIGFVIYRDTVLYFVATALANTTLLVIPYLGPGYGAYKPTAVPFSMLVTVTMGSRVFLNLKLYNARKSREELRLSMQSRSHSEGHVSPPKGLRLSFTPSIPALSFGNTLCSPTSSDMGRATQLTSLESRKTLEVNITRETNIRTDSLFSQVF